MRPLSTFSCWRRTYSRLRCWTVLLPQRFGSMFERKWMFSNKQMSMNLKTIKQMSMNPKTMPDLKGFGQGIHECCPKFLGLFEGDSPKTPKSLKRPKKYTWIASIMSIMSIMWFIPISITHAKIIMSMINRCMNRSHFLVLWNMFCFPFSWECHHPNWLRYFSEG